MLEQSGDRATGHAGQHEPEAAALQEAGQEGQEVGVVLRVQCMRLLHDQVLHSQVDMPHSGAHPSGSSMPALDWTEVV